jgi:hypothetical protein
VSVVALSNLRTVPSHENGLLLGFAPFGATDMRRALIALGGAMQCIATRK